jgi:hypothetical protein
VGPSIMPARRPPKSPEIKAGRPHPLPSIGPIEPAEFTRKMKAVRAACRRSTSRPLGQRVPPSGSRTVASGRGTLNRPPSQFRSCASSSLHLSDPSPGTA